MWMILVGVTVLSVVEAVKLEKRSGLKFQKVRQTSPDPASTLNRRI